ncbi:unnamed protein product, partial [Tuber aestivum]
MYTSSSMSGSPTAGHYPNYKDFLFDGTVTLRVGPHRRSMEMHKKLLASISPELDKHVYNDMREGAEGMIYFPDEEVVALSLFIEWAYTGEYDHDEYVPLSSTGDCTEQRRDPWASLHKHLQLCVFSDKFNIPTLRKLAESEFYASINPIVPESKEDGAGLVMAIDYAYGNLLDTDPIVGFLAQYASWKLELLRETDGFEKLILA